MTLTVIKDPKYLAVLLVYGYVRNIEKNTSMIDKNNHNVSDLYNIVRSYHFVPDLWDKTITSNTFNINKEYLKLKQNAGCYNTFYNAFGTIKVKSGERKLWRIKICKLDQQFWAPIVSLSIGIINSCQVSKIKSGTNYCDDEYGGYGFIVGNGWLKHSSIDSIKTYGTVCKQNDVIRMELDLIKSTLKYCINNREYGIAFQNVITNDNIEYILAVSMWKGDEIRLIE